MPESIVMDASAMVDYLVDSHLAQLIANRIQDTDVNVPAHFDAEILSALGRLHRAGKLTEAEVQQRVDLTAEAPFQRHLLPGQSTRTSARSTPCTSSWRTNSTPPSSPPTPG